jgi:hypothetical protein
MGADNARILVMVATAAVGSGLSQFLKVLPKLPGAPQASELAVAEGGVSFEQAGAVEGVTIGKGGLTISLATGAVPATSLGGDFSGAPRINLLSPAAGTAAKLDRLLGFLKPSGRLIGEPGTSSKIRILPGGEKEARVLFEQLAVRATRHGRAGRLQHHLPGYPRGDRRRWDRRIPTHLPKWSTDDRRLRRGTWYTRDQVRAVREANVPLSEDKRNADSSRRLSSRDLAALVIDALLHAKLLRKEDVERALDIATEEIDARKAVGDY